ncbi:hypothetical protein KC343_g5140 [Hortaea werneckii]|nr:hypothetical protein KC338_g2267 [Hortaea werneckii]KAI7259808.1 hypothetical protein KC352_g10353 [Hortaea werneckii]KAI7353020.1 hypothetical protein KC320_g4189 [Hortaea werneckii]KAI7567768.1 hypothetical protein KC317_g4755 [Hortaea werneckii]KAI7619370.1 hypothetical protein KC346_g4604 [Hortaea werneckii]
MVSPNNSNSVGCSVCFNTVTQSQALHEIEGNTICNTCIKDYLVPLFEQATNFESHFPPCWGATEIQPEPFKAFLGDTLMRRYQRVACEYRTTAPDRLYCQHSVLASSEPSPGASAGVKIALTPQQIQEAVERGGKIVRCSAMVATRTFAKDPEHKPFTCYKCKGLVCGMCEQSVAEEEHDCVTKPLIPSEPEDRFQDMQRGRDYQFCCNYPSCPQVVELREGCNSICCPGCNATFCFVCGESVEATDAVHFQAGKPCPRFGQPGAPHALFDRPQIRPRLQRPAQGYLAESTPLQFDDAMAFMENVSAQLRNHIGQGNSRRARARDRRQGVDTFKTLTEVFGILEDGISAIFSLIFDIEHGILDLEDGLGRAPTQLEIDMEALRVLLASRENVLASALVADRLIDRLPTGYVQRHLPLLSRAWYFLGIQTANFAWDVEGAVNMICLRHSIPRQTIAAMMNHAHMVATMSMIDRD